MNKDLILLMAIICIMADEFNFDQNQIKMLMGNKFEPFYDSIKDVSEEETRDLVYELFQEYLAKMPEKQ